jgi:phage anti-repressor protein
MDLPIYISKKGTKVVAATELHQALQLTDHHYATNVKRWITDIYEFRDDIRRPEKLRDFANRKAKGNPILKDYYLTVELAKLICLSSKSKVKLKYAKLLSHAETEEAESNTARLNEEDVMKVLELTKAMSMVSCQEAAEKSHLKVYEARNGGQTANWWKYRAEVLGYSATGLRRKLMAMGKPAQGKTQRQMLLQLDAYELIRTAVIDQFMAMGKTRAFACSMGDLAKRFAKELRIEVQDDREGMASLFAPRANDRLVREIRSFEPKVSAMTA